MSMQTKVFNHSDLFDAVQTYGGSQLQLGPARKSIPLLNNIQNTDELNPDAWGDVLHLVWTPFID